MVIQGLCYKLVYFFFNADIGLHPQGLGACRDVRNSLVDACLVNIGHHNCAGALLRKALTERLANAASASSYYNNLALNLHISLFSITRLAFDPGAG